jgi:hypothetical protein
MCGFVGRLAAAAPFPDLVIITVFPLIIIIAVPPTQAGQQLRESLDSSHHYHSTHYGLTLWHSLLLIARLSL